MSLWRKFCPNQGVYSELFIQNFSAPLQQPPMVPLGGTMIALPQRRGLPRLSRRSIRYGRATDQEGFNPLVWSTLWFVGQSVSLLRRDIANALGEHDQLNITLCLRGGSEGRLTPLVTDLPRDEQTMEIVVFTTGSQGESLAVLSVACAATFICFSSHGRC